MKARWARIWCSTPVAIETSSSVKPERRSTGAKRVSAGRAPCRAANSGSLAARTLRASWGSCARGRSTSPEAGIAGAARLAGVVGVVRESKVNLARGVDLARHQREVALLDGAGAELRAQQ